MKKLMFLTAAAAILSISVLAQDTKEKSKEMKTSNIEWEKKIIADLKLTDAQVAKFDALNSEFTAKVEVMKQNTDMSKEDYKEKKTALKKEKEAAFIQLLTTEQQIKYREILEKKNTESKSQASNKPAQQ